MIQRGRAVKMRIMATASGVCVCLALLIVVSGYLPLVSAAEAENDAVRYGSLLLTTSSMGYIVIGVLAFLLGVFASLLCLYLKKRAEIKHS